MAQRDAGANTVAYLHGDHLGSVSLSTDATGALVSRQEFDPWGKVRSGGLWETNLNYTGQRLDGGTDLLYYHSRYYDPALGRFISPDSIVPGTASGKGGATVCICSQRELRPLTVDFHEPGFVMLLNQENMSTLANGFWFQLGGQDRQKTKNPSGPVNVQGLNRYSYVLNNPLRYTDPTGHDDYISGGDENRGYKEQCTNRNGGRGDCGGEYTNPIERDDGDPKKPKQRLIRIWNSKDGESKYVWSDDPVFAQDFKKAIDNYDIDKVTLVIYIIALFPAILTAVLSCFVTGGWLCFAIVATAVVAAGGEATYIWSVSQDIDKANNAFRRIKGITPPGESPA